MGKKQELKAEIQRLERINLELTEAAQLEDVELRAEIQKIKASFFNQYKLWSANDVELSNEIKFLKKGFKTPWNLLSEKIPICDNKEQDGGFLSEAILIRNTSGLIYEVFARQYPDYVNLAFFTAESQDFKNGDSFICEVFIDDVVEWMEIPKN